MRIDVSVQIAYTVHGKKTTYLSGSYPQVVNTTGKGETVYEDFILRNQELR